MDCRGPKARPRLPLAGSGASWPEIRRQSYASSPKACARTSQRLQEIHHRVDFLFGQNAVAPERRHHGQRVAQGFVVENGDEILALGILALDVDQFGPDRAGQVATLDDVAGQAVALAAVESELAAFLDRGLRLRGADGSESADR